MDTKMETATYLTMAQAEEKFLSENSTTVSTKKKTKKTINKTVKKISKTPEVISPTELSTHVEVAKTSEVINESNEATSNLVQNGNGNKTGETSESKQTKKKGKRSATGKQNISMKSSFNKFDNLEKLHRTQVCLSDADNAQKLLITATDAPSNHCHRCLKTVYKMEEIKAENHIYHKNCFRCHECEKQLKVDNYQSHESVLYCIIHFKLLFAPKFVEEPEPLAPKKPELIIRENQPIELPPEVVRASDKPDLGLEELQKLNVRSRFEVFQNPSISNHQQSNAATQRVAKSNSSILLKLAKLKAQGFDVGEIDNEGEETLMENSGSDQDDEDNDDMEGIDKRSNLQKECPIGIGRAMEDIKSKFENGPFMRREERREETKQEIQNIRSRLFMGKQARIKEMYQQAVSECEQTKTSVGKKTDFEIDGLNSKSLKERFENGDIFNNEDHEKENDAKSQIESDVFESGLSKKSRSIFLEMDANVSSHKDQKSPLPKPSSSGVIKPIQNDSRYKQMDQISIVKYDENPEDIEIKTSEISQKFKFFETYKPETLKKKEFRITPPRDGVIKMPSPESDHENVDETEEESDTNILVKSHTTSKMLDKFRSLELSNRLNNENKGPKPLKCFTPPPDDGRHGYESNNSDQVEDDEYADSNDDDDELEEMDEEEKKNLRRAQLRENDEALKEAESAARAKLLRSKFEKWEANESDRETKDDQINVYSRLVSDDSNIESTKTIRERFESMNCENKPSNRQRYRVNRFV